MKPSREIVYQRPRRAIRSFRFESVQRNPYRRVLFNPVLTTDVAARVGVVSDIHHNTYAFSKILADFGEMGVNVLFLLGDYSFIPSSLKGADPSDLRFRQFNKVMQLAREYQLKHGAKVVCIMGNHEIEEWYFAKRSTSRRRMQMMVPTLRKWGFILQEQPFAGFEIREACQATVFSNISKFDENLDVRRSFLLSHAISSPLVKAMYQGFSDDPARAKKERDDIDRALGHLWGEYIDYASRDAKKLWGKFLTARDTTVINAIKQNIANSLSFDELCKNHQKSKWVKWFSKLSDEAISSLTYHWCSFGETFPARDFCADLPPGLDAEQNSLSIVKTLESVGVGADYALSGHFHADLGVYDISRRFGCLGLAGAGLQINKTITQDLCCYVIEINTDGDTIHRLSLPAHLDGMSDAEVDLSESLAGI